MPEPKRVTINLDPNAYALTGINVMFDEEQFVFQVTSGNQIRGYIASPKHAKRLLLLLQKQMEAYEKKYGELKTSLPKVKKTTGRKVGF